MQLNETMALQKLRLNPKKVMDNARKGNKQDLVELSNFWINMAPELFKLDLLSVFYGHLNVLLIPTFPAGSRSPSFSDMSKIDCAWVSLVALTKLGNVIYPPHPLIPVADIEKKSLGAWEGVFKWCSFMYTTRVLSNGTHHSLEHRRSAMDIIGGVLYSLSRSDAIRKVMVDTPGSVELATRLWIIEDEPAVPSGLPIPVNSAALDGLLTISDWKPQPPTGENDVPKSPKRQEEEDKQETIAISRREAVRNMLDRVVAAAGGMPSHVVSMALSRLRTATSTDARMHDPRTAISLDLIGHLSRSPNHPFRLGFLSEGMTTLAAKLAVKAVGLLDTLVAPGGGGGQLQIAFRGGNPSASPHEEGLHGALIASLGFLANTLESTDGFTWVIKAVSAGLLQAWVGAARHMHRFNNIQDADMILGILRKLVPKYMVYKSVVTNVESVVRKIKEDVGQQDWRHAEATKVWKTFERMTLERYMVGVHMKAVKNKAATCDNFKCQKVDAKNTFQKCSSCASTMYCSKECQRVAWKEGGHRVVCKLKQQELREGKYQSISKTDSAYFHHLATRDARHHLPLLKHLAKSKYPALAENPTSLVINIDYLVYPPIVDLHPLAEHEKHSPKASPETSVNAEARNDELIQRARDHPGKYGLIQSKMANGQGLQSVQSIVPGSFWAGWNGEEAKFDEDDDDILPDATEENSDFLTKTMDEVDMMMGRMALNRFLRSMGQPETL